MTAPSPGTARRRKPGARGSKVRADIRRADGESSTRYFTTWASAAAFLAGEAFAKDSPGITSVRLVNQGAQRGGTR